MNLVFRNALITTFASLLFTARVFAAESKYGIVDMQTVILSVEEGKKARSELEKAIKGKEEGFKKRKEELDKMNESWKTQMSVLSEDAKVKKQQEFQQKFFDLRNDEMAFREDVKRKEQKATQEIAMKVAGLVEKIAQEKKLDIVFETNSAGLIYVASPVELTKEVIDRYGKLPASKTASADKSKDDKSDKSKDVKTK